MAEVVRSRSTSLYIHSRPPREGGSMSVEALRDFVQTLDAEGISDKTTVVCHHVNQSKRPVTLSVKEATTEESREPDGDPQPEVEAAPDGGDV